MPDAADEPGKRLVGYDRVALEPGASQRVTVDVSSETADEPFSIWNVDTDEWEIVNGEYTVLVGASSRDLPLTASAVVDTAGVSPTVSATVSPSTPDGEAGWYVSPVTVTATATDDLDPAPVVETSMDGAEWVVGATVTVDTDGDHVVGIRAKDAAGNVSDVTSLRLPVDRTAPVVTAKADRDARTIVLEATDATSGVASVEWARAGGAPQWQEYTGALPVATSGERIVFRATDVAGNGSAVGEFDYAADAPTTPAAPGAGNGSGTGQTGGLASTGVEAGAIGALALGLLVAGAVTGLVRRRRKTAA
jgi:beta-glucosidase